MFCCVSGQYNRDHTHRTSRRLPCKLCPQSGFSDRNAWKLHQLTDHKNESYMMCEICCKTFKSTTGFSDHNRIHHSLPCDKQFTCTVCLKSYTSRYKLGEHERRHSSQKPFKCSNCQRSYKYKRDLYRHNRNCHAK